MCGYFVYTVLYIHTYVKANPLLHKEAAPLTSLSLSLSFNVSYIILHHSWGVIELLAVQHIRSRSEAMYHTAKEAQSHNKCLRSD